LSFHFTLYGENNFIIGTRCFQYIIKAVKLLEAMASVLQKTNAKRFYQLRAT